jgi:hypothetical protein
LSEARPNTVTRGWVRIAPWAGPSIVTLGAPRRSAIVTSPTVNVRVTVLGVLTSTTSSSSSYSGKANRAGAGS